MVGLALLVVGEDLQLAGQVDAAYVDTFGHREDRRREVEDAADADLDHTVADGLRRDGGGGDDADADAVLGDDGLELLEAADLQAGHDLAGPAAGRVEQRHGAE